MEAFGAEGPDVDGVTCLEDVDGSLAWRTGVLQFALQQSGREGRGVEWRARESFQHVGDGADMVFMRVRI